MSKHHRTHRAEGQKPEDNQAPSVQPPAPDPGIPSAAFTLWTAEDPPAHPPVLIVIRTMVSGRHVLCRLGERRDLVCDVRVALNFRRDMMLFGARTRPELGDRAWRYDGPLPRRSGRW